MKRFPASTTTTGLALAAMLVVAGCQPQEPVGVGETSELIPQFSTTAEPEAAENFVVEFSGSVDELIAAVEDLGGTVHRAHPEIGIASVAGLDDAAAESLKGAEGVEEVNRDLLVQWSPSPEEFELESAASTEGHVVGDPTTAVFYPCQWNMSQCNAPAAWAQGKFGAGAKVAVLDSGVDPTHQDLAGRIDVANSVSMLSNPSLCDAFAPDQGTIFDFRFHGSFVAGIIAANGLGVAGVAPDAMIVGVKVLNCLGSGTFADVIAGILYAANLPDVDVINMSLGAYFPKNLPGGGPLNAALAKAVNYANSKGVLVVSSAGNNGADLDRDRNSVVLPAQAGAGIGAWAGDIDGNLASYSNHGLTGAWVGAGGGDNTPGSPQIPLPGCGLPAGGHDGIVSVCSTFSLFFGCGPNSYLFNGTGTSFSAPLVSGVAALVDGKAGGSLDAGQLKTILKNTADDLGRIGADNLFSYGRVNAGNAVQY